MGEGEKEAEEVGQWGGSGSHNREIPNIYRLAVLFLCHGSLLKESFNSGNKRERDSDSCISCLV